MIFIKFEIVEFTKMLLLSETHRRPIEYPSHTNMPDRRPRHTSFEIQLKPTCPSDTDIPDRQPIEDQHVWPETDMPDQRPTYMLSWRHIGDRHS